MSSECSLCFRMTAIPIDRDEYEFKLSIAEEHGIEHASNKFRFSDPLIS